MTVRYGMWRRSIRVGVITRLLSRACDANGNIDWPAPLAFSCQGSARGLSSCLGLVLGLLLNPSERVRLLDSRPVSGMCQDPPDFS